MLCLEIFQKVKERLSTNIVAWGYQESKEDYYRTLASCHVVVSTAIHEFFGVAMYVYINFTLVRNALFEILYWIICLPANMQDDGDVISFTLFKSFVKSSAPRINCYPLLAVIFFNLWGCRFMIY